MTFCHKDKKHHFCRKNTQLRNFLSRKFRITHLSIAFEDLLGSSIAPQVMPQTLALDSRFVKHIVLTFARIEDTRTCHFLMFKVWMIL